MQMDIKRAVLTVIFTASCFILWQNWQLYNAPPASVVSTSSSSSDSAVSASDTASAPGAAIAGTSVAPQTELKFDAYKSAARAIVTTDMVRAEISAIGGAIVRLELLNHKATEDQNQNYLLLDDGKAHNYLALSGLHGAGLPDHKTVFDLSAREIVLKEGEQSVQLRLNAPAVNGVSVVKVLTFRRGSYMIDVGFEIKNDSAAPLNTQAYFELARDTRPVEQAGGFMTGISTYTGPAYFTDSDKFKKIDFAEIQKKAEIQKDALRLKWSAASLEAEIAKKASKTVDVKSTDGWVAMVQHYFVSAFVPVGNVERTYFTRETMEGLFGIGIKQELSVPVGQSAKVVMPLYAGPQEQQKLKKIAPGLDLVVDYGWVTMIAVPLFVLLSLIHGVVGNWGWAIILLTVLIKAVFFPLSAASYKSMAKMKTLMPKMKALQDRYKTDKMKLNQEMMALYKTEKVNPMGGCLPILVQIPVFMALYWTLLGAVEMRQAPWLGWIQDLSAMDPYYVLPVLMAISMFIQTKLNPTPPDPMQAKVMLAMPLIFGVMFLWMPSGLVLYWVVNNVLSIGQQWYITRSIENASQGAKAK
jgi:YidC/Oxa1 family membrane protein insertase